MIKREDMQPVFSFKIRGAYNKIAQLSEEEKKLGVSVVLLCPDTTLLCAGCGVLGRESRSRSRAFVPKAQYACRNCHASWDSAHQGRRGKRIVDKSTIFRRLL